MSSELRKFASPARLLAGVARRVRDVPHLVMWHLQRDGYGENLRKIETFFEKHKGGTCVIVGNGPSLKRTPVSAIATGVPVFILNRGYLHPISTHVPAYYVAINELVVQQWWKDIAALPMPKFLNWTCRGLFSPTPEVVFLRIGFRRRFQRDITKPLWGGATVTYVALQVAYYMGFHKVVLVGVDHRYAVHGRPHKVVTSVQYDASHFTPEYFGPGTKWQLPDLITAEAAFKMARDAYEKSGRIIIDATVGGNLHVFPKMSLSQALAFGE